LSGAVLKAKGSVFDFFSTGIKKRINDNSKEGCHWEHPSLLLLEIVVGGKID
jgi:hypothetical protein